MKTSKAARRQRVLDVEEVRERRRKAHDRREPDDGARHGERENGQMISMISPKSDISSSTSEDCEMPATVPAT